MDFVRSYFSTNEPLTSWTLFSDVVIRFFFPQFWNFQKVWKLTKGWSILSFRRRPFKHTSKHLQIWCQCVNYSVGGSVCSYWAASESHQCAWQSLWIKMNMQQQQMGKIDSQSLTYDSSTYLTGLRKWRGVNYVVQYWQETTENILEIHQWFSFWHDMY